MEQRQWNQLIRELRGLREEIHKLRIGMAREEKIALADVQRESIGDHIVLNE